MANMFKSTRIRRMSDWARVIHKLRIAKSFRTRKNGDRIHGRASARAKALTVFFCIPNVFCQEKILAPPGAIFAFAKDAHG